MKMYKNIHYQISTSLNLIGIYMGMKGTSIYLCVCININKPRHPFSNKNTNSIGQLSYQEDIGIESLTRQFFFSNEWVFL